VLVSERPSKTDSYECIEFVEEDALEKVVNSISFSSSEEDEDSFNPFVEPSTRSENNTVKSKDWCRGEAEARLKRRLCVILFFSLCNKAILNWKNEEEKYLLCGIKKTARAYIIDSHASHQKRARFNALSLSLSEELLVAEKKHHHGRRRRRCERE
jgi:hypothetical protein